MSRLIPPHLPRTIACVGRNFADHIKELGNAQPTEPFYFLKPAGSVLFPGEGPVLMPRGCDLHYEVELVAVIKRDTDVWKGGRDELGEVVKGWCVGIDMTARNYQEAAKKKSLPWSLSKGFKTFLPLSHFIPFDLIPDPHNVELHLEVNGQQRQKDSTNLMLFDIAKLLEHVTGVMPLMEDDLLLTGTPKGVGKVVPGDRMTAGLKVEGVELEEARIDVLVEERSDGYGSEDAMNVKAKYEAAL
ncbi:hypothetical protein BDZ91DRAFT_720458 [Kalaharituber pfeilii]|nr:hypothetical protein BDZ91DRAFT_720458 [Kalaharituber pfeilii]